MSPAERGAYIAQQYFWLDGGDYRGSYELITDLLWHFGTCYDDSDLANLIQSAILQFELESGRDVDLC